jgi:hypothetical protein
VLEAVAEFVAVLVAKIPAETDVIADQQIAAERAVDCSAGSRRYILRADATFQVEAADTGTQPDDRRDTDLPDDFVCRRRCLAECRGRLARKPLAIQPLPSAQRLSRSQRAPMRAGFGAGVAMADFNAGAADGVSAGGSGKSRRSGSKDGMSCERIVQPETC